MHKGNGINLKQEEIIYGVAYFAGHSEADIYKLEAKYRGLSNG